MARNRAFDERGKWVCCNHTQTHARMGLDHGELLVSQTIWLAQDSVGSADFAQIVEKTAKRDPCDFGFTETRG